jgi:hypothetical protein
MRTISRIFLVVIVGLVSGILFSQTFERTTTETVQLDAAGKAILKRVDQIPGSTLGQIYAQHAKAMEEYTKVKSNFLKEQGRAWSLLTGKLPRYKLEDQQIGNGITRILSGTYPGLAHIPKDDKTVREVSIKQFVDKKKDEKRLLQYYELILDTHFFETTFLGGQKGSATIRGERETQFILPPGAELVNRKELEGKTWKVDFGGGTVMNARLVIEDDRVVLKEVETVSASAPTALLSHKNVDLFDTLRDYAAFVIRYRLDRQAALVLPDVFEPAVEQGLDYSGSWNTSVSQLISKAFSYQTLTVTPSVNLTFNLGASLFWEHQWVKVSWWRWSYNLKKFEAKLILNPVADASVSVSSGGTLSKEWDQNLFTKSTTVSFSIGFVPVIIVLEAKLDAGAKASISGVITATAGGKLSISETLTAKWEGSWSATQNFNLSTTFTGFTANAQVTTMARGEAPFQVTAYLYYVAGPFLQLVPYVQANAGAQAGTTTGVSYSIVGGLEVNGGATVAGWLKSITGDLGTYSKTFINPEKTIKSGTYNF